MAVNNPSPRAQPEDKDCLQAIISEATGDNYYITTNLIGPVVYDESALFKLF